MCYFNLNSNSVVFVAFIVFAVVVVFFYSSKTLIVPLQDNTVDLFQSTLLVESIYVNRWHHRLDNLTAEWR